MTEYIDRERVLELASHNILDMDYFMEIPAADVAPVVHGKWNLIDGTHVVCSECKKIRNIETQLGWNFCPRCGAKMDLEE